MATLKVNRSDRFPVGTSVGAYAHRNRQHAGKPAGSAVETHAVDAEGVLTFTTLVANVRYTLWAEVEGEHRYVLVEGPQSVAVPVVGTDGRTAPVRSTLQDRLSQRRQLTGAGVGAIPGGDI